MFSYITETYENYAFISITEKLKRYLRKVPNSPLTTGVVYKLLN